MNYYIKSIFGLSLFCCVVLLSSCEEKTQYYTIDDFREVPKIDAHFHYFSLDDRYMDYVSSMNFKLLSPNVDSGYPVDEQLKISAEILQRHAGMYAFLGTFSVEHYGEPGFSESIVEVIDHCMDEGASGIKIWKNIGMVLQDSSGRYVMADDPAFEPVFRNLEEKKIPLLAHLGEPRNCWLPLEEMTDDGDRSYYGNNPQYHMYLHPERPSYEDQINTRDKLLEKYPGIIFIGAHLGSLEWNVDSLAKRLDQYPHFKVDMSARIGHLRNQSSEDWDRVRNFMIQYQDRLLYATDMSVNDLRDDDLDEKIKSINNTWMRDWLYLATDSTVNDIRGLQLPKEVIDKVYYTNAEFLFHGS